MRGGVAPVRSVWALVYGTVIVVGVTAGVRVVVGGYSPVPFADLWAMFPFIERGVQGDVGLADLWAQHNEHRMAMARLQFLIDYRYFDGTNIFLFVVDSDDVPAARRQCSPPQSGSTCAIGSFASASWPWPEHRRCPVAGTENLTLAVKGVRPGVSLRGGLDSRRRDGRPHPRRVHARRFGRA